MSKNSQTMTPQANESAAVRKPALKVQSYFGVKALIISFSLLGTMGGWAVLAVGQIKDAQAKQIEDVLAKKIEQAEQMPSHAANWVQPTEPTRNIRAAATTPMRTKSIVKNIEKPGMRSTPVNSATSVAANGNKKSAAQVPVLRDVPARVRTVARSRSSQ